MDGRENRSGGKTRRLERIRRNLGDAGYTKKLWQTLWICSTFVVIGIVYGQRGPSFLDLQIITHTNIEQVSQFFTSQSAGYITGAVIAGVLYDYYPKHRSLLLFSTTVLMSVTTIVIPWCSHYLAMVVMFFLCAAFLGALDASANTSILSIWGVHGTPYMQTAHFCYAVGGFIVPLFTEPFLMPVVGLQQNLTDSPISNCNVFNQDTSFNISRPDQRPTPFKLLQGNKRIMATQRETIVENFTYMAGRLNCSMTQDGLHSSSDELGYNGETKLYIAYLISGILGLLSSVPFIVNFCRSNPTKCEQQREKHVTNKSVHYRRGRSKQQFAFILLLIALMYCLSIAVETAFSNFLLAFAVRRLRWTKSAASVLTSVYWAAFAAGRFLSIWTSTVVSPVTMLSICCISLTVVMTCFTVCALFMVHQGIWVFTFCCGIAMAPLFPTGLMWTEQDLFKFSGKLFSVIVLASSTGAIANPPILGHLLQHFSQMWYAYLLLVECVALAIVFFILKLFIRVNRVPKPIECQSITVSYRGENEEEELNPAINN